MAFTVLSNWVAFPLIMLMVALMALRGSRTSSGGLIGLKTSPFLSKTP
jgi:ACR3 family arsenite efflux pump ArsB